MRSKLSAALVPILAIALMSGAPTAASAQTELPPGWTYESYTAAALSQGYSLETIERALEDPRVFAALVVRTEAQETTASRLPTQGEVQAASLADQPVPLAVVTASHSRIAYNALGHVVRRLTLFKQFNATGVGVVAMSSWYEVEVNSAVGEYFVGIVGEQEYYTTEGGRANGGHTSRKDGNFDNYVLPGTVSYWVSIKGLWNGSTVKAAGG